MEYSAFAKQTAFLQHALNGPFDNPRFLPGSQLPGALCMARNCLYSRLNGLEQYSTWGQVCQVLFCVGSDQSRSQRKSSTEKGNSRDFGSRFRRKFILATPKAL